MTKTLTPLAAAKAKLRAGWRPKKLLSDNTKRVNGEKYGWTVQGLQLAPANTSGFEVCASRSEACTEHCIFTAGRGIFPQIQEARIFRTLWFMHHRGEFMAQLYKEIKRAPGAAVRLNVFSDWQWERQSFEIDGVGKFRNLMEAFPNTVFYDYTKHYARMFRPRPANYHLTYSLHENNEKEARVVLRTGANVAAVTESIGGTLFGYNVIDGDDHDLRFLDPSPCIVGLHPKGSLRTAQDKEMLYVPDIPQPEGNFEAA